MTVDAREGTGRIEIELVPHDPEGGDGHAAIRSAEARVARPTDGAGVGRTYSPPTLLAAAIVGVIGLVVGIVIGRSGADRPAGDAAPATTAEAVSPSRTEPIETRPPTALPPPPATIETVTDLTPRPGAATGPLDDADGGSRPVLPTAPGRTGVRVETTQAVDASLRGAAGEVVGLSVAGDLVYLDLATGRAVTHRFADRVTGPPVLYAGDGWIARPSWDDREGWTIVDDDGAESSALLSGALVQVSNPSSGRVWIFDPASPGVGAGGLAVEVTLDGEPTGRRLELPGIPEAWDPLDEGIVVAAPGGTYVVGPDGSARVTRGRLIALGRDRAVAWECDEALVCRHVVIERATGDRRPLDLDPELGARMSLRSGTAWTRAAALDATGDLALVITVDAVGTRPAAGGVLDLATGEWIEITDNGDAAMMRWGPVDRTVLWLDRGRLTVFDIATRVSTPVAPELGLLTAFTWRETVPSVDDGDDPVSSDGPAGSATGSVVVD